MTRVTFIEADGAVHEVDALNGESLMQAAAAHNVPGILAECGGHLSCSTCHGYIDEEWLHKLTPPSDDEQTMIDCTLQPQPNSRLTCQVQLGPELDGIVVRLPESQV